MKQYATIESPVYYGNLKLKNRIIFAPTTLGLRENEYIEKIESIAKGGCAMIIIGDVPVGNSHFGHSLFSKKGFQYYQKITKTAHRYNCRVCAQLHQNDTNFKGMFKYIPKMITGKMTAMDLRKVVNEQTGKYISSLSISEIRKITNSFGSAAVQAVKAGFDMVQVHGDRMCGSFSSSLFNTRSDLYGGDVQKRTLFAVEAVQAIHTSVPNIPIDYKLAIRQEDPDYGKAGILPEEISVFVPALEKAGVSSFHVALANHGNLSDTIPPFDHPEFGGEGCFLKFCDQVKNYTNLPICGVGGLTDPDFIEEQLLSGRINCAAMSRQLIADPEWVNKLISGNIKSIHRCIRCNKKCLGGMYEHKGVHCIYENSSHEKKGNL